MDARNRAGTRHHKPNTAPPLVACCASRRPSPSVLHRCKSSQRSDVFSARRSCINTMSHEMGAGCYRQEGRKGGQPGATRGAAQHSTFWRCRSRQSPSGGPCRGCPPPRPPRRCPTPPAAACPPASPLPAAAPWRRAAGSLSQEEERKRRGGKGNKDPALQRPTPHIKCIAWRVCASQAHRRARGPLRWAPPP